MLKTILEEGELVENRTGVSAYTYPHMMIRHDMADGFPLLTTKKMAWKSIKVELEFFIKGLTDKKWLQDRGCHIWDGWAARYLSYDKKQQFESRNLGPIYGYQWRNFNKHYIPIPEITTELKLDKNKEECQTIHNKGIDQLAYIVNELKTNPTNRQLVCSAWNPCQLDKMALSPCHVLWHVWTSKSKLHLCWFQRSSDFFLGKPFNLASYGLLLHLLCKETGYQEGILTGFISNCHLYENHVLEAKIQLAREPFDLPSVSTTNFKSIFEWEHKDTELLNYQSHSAIKADIAI